MNGGFLQRHKPNPIGIGLVVTGHAAILTAIALAPPEVVKRVLPGPLIVQTIEEEAPPPPPPADMAPQRPAQPTTADPIVKSGIEPMQRFDPPALTPPPPIEPISPVRAEPVFAPATIAPEAMARFQPEYPTPLVRAEIEGSATVRVLIGSDGRVKSVEMVDATDPAFFEATRKQALRHWRFKPATSDGVAIESWRTMTVRFTLTS